MADDCDPEMIRWYGLIEREGEAPDPELNPAHAGFAALRELFRGWGKVFSGLRLGPGSWGLPLAAMVTVSKIPARDQADNGTLLRRFHISFTR